MDCVFVREHIFSYREEELSDREKIEFEEHLQSCDECGRIATGVLSVVAFIDKKKADAPNPFIQTRTIQRIGSELERIKETPNPLFWRGLQPAIVSLLLLVAVSIGFLIGKQINSGYSTETERQNEIQSLKSNLFIQDFIDNDRMFFSNH